MGWYFSRSKGRWWWYLIGWISRCCIYDVVIDGDYEVVIKVIIIVDNSYDVWVDVIVRYVVLEGVEKDIFFKLII